jgi:hypothetical protein
MMKKGAVSVFAIVVALTAVPAFAVVKADKKNECLLYGNDCPSNANSLPDRIAMLKTEIAKGEKIYTPEELKLLGLKLKEDNDIMRWFRRSK